MKMALLVFFSVNCFLSGIAQSKLIRDIFMLLPSEKVYGLTKATRDSMLQLHGKTYYPASNDSSTIEAFNYGISVHVKEYMYISTSYETEQRASGMIEIRTFKTKNGQQLVLVSETGGVWQANYQQVGLATFLYSANKKFVPYQKKVLPAMDEKLFLKPGTPDSIIKLVLNNSNCSFDLSQEKISWDLNSRYLSDNPAVRKWLKGDSAEFSWTGSQFILSRFVFD